MSIPASGSISKYAIEFDLDSIQSVGEVMFGELRDGRKALILLNRAILTNQELSEARVTISLGEEDLSKSIEDSGNDPAISWNNPTNDEMKKDFKEQLRSCISYSPDKGVDLYGSRASFRASKEQWDALDWANGCPKDPVAAVHRHYVGSFSPYLSHMRDFVQQPKPPAPPQVESHDPDGCTVVYNERDMNMRAVMLTDRLWISLMDLHMPMFAPDKCALAQEELEIVKSGEPHLRVCHTAVTVDRITEILVKHADVQEVSCMMNKKYPWVISAMVLVVKPDDWQKFMRDFKCLESRWLVWFCRNRRGCAVDVMNAQRQLTVEYPPLFRGPMVPRALIIENPTMFFDENNLYAEASRLIKFAEPAPAARPSASSMPGGPAIDSDGGSSSSSSSSRKRVSDAFESL